MKQILVIYKSDNGYKCGCCGQEWEESELHEIPDGQDVQDFLKEDQEYTDKWYLSGSGFSGSGFGGYGRFKILKAYIVQDEIEFKKKD